MKLTKKINIQVIEVIAEYKVNAHNSPFLAIVECAKELENNQVLISPERLQSDLLNPLPWQACYNLLKRMVSMSYLSNAENSDYDNEEHLFKLTGLGHKAAEKNTFYEQRKGALKLYIWDKKVVRVEELDRTNIDEYKTVKENYPIKELNQEFTLNNKEYILDGFETKYAQLKEVSEILSLEINANNSNKRILDYEETIELSKENCIKQLLNNEFNNTYKDNVLPLIFDSKKLSLVQEITISKPCVNNQYFSPTVVKNVNVCPQEHQADLWYRAMLKNEVKDYFLSDSDFNDFANAIAMHFGQYSGALTNSISRTEMIDETDNFYSRTKLEAINFLNY